MNYYDTEFGGPAYDAWPTMPGQKLIPHKGGDGGAGAAQQQERDRQARIDAATAGINSIFADSGRDATYAAHKDAVFDINKRDIDEQYTDAERENRFGLARAGLMGGSVDVDSNEDLTERMNKGLMQATGLADTAASDLKMQDERARQSLTSLAQSGIDTGTAQTMALRQLDANAQAASAARQGSTVGNLFDDMSQAYLLRQQNAGMQAGRGQAGSQWYGVSNPRTGDSGSIYKN